MLSDVSAIIEQCLAYHRRRGCELHSWSTTHHGGELRGYWRLSARFIKDPESARSRDLYLGALLNKTIFYNTPSQHHTPTPTWPQSASQPGALPPPPCANAEPPTPPKNAASPPPSTTLQHLHPPDQQASSPTVSMPAHHSQTLSAASPKSHYHPKK